MRRAVSMALVVSAAVGVHAQAVPTTRPGVVWLSPRDGAVLDLATFQARPVSLTSPQQLSATTWLTTTLRPGELVWVRVADAVAASSVRFARLATNDSVATLTDMRAIRKGPNDFVLAAPLGPPMQLALQAQSAGTLPSVQLWLAAARSPGYRWELWEDQAKHWANDPVGLPPPTPNEASRDMIERLAVVPDALARAGRQDKADHHSAVSALLAAEALLNAGPSRETVAPYARRIELTQEVAKAARLPQFDEDGTDVAQLRPGQRVNLTVSGPGTLQIEARAEIASVRGHLPASFDLVLRSGNRVVALASGPVSRPAASTESTGELVSTLRRLIATAPPGVHQYALESRGATLRIRVFSHRRQLHVEDAVAGSEDIGGLLQLAASDPVSGLVRDLLVAEAAFTVGRERAAVDGFTRVYAAAHDPGLRAFALGRKAALAPNAVTAVLESRAALALLTGLTGESIARLRDVLALEGAIRALADGNPVAAHEFSRRVPSMSARFPTWAGTFLRDQAGARSASLAVLGQAVRMHPLDEALLRVAGRDWWNGSRWVPVPMEAGRSARTAEIVAPSRMPLSCAQANEDGDAALAPLPAGDVALRVTGAQANSAYLRRFNLLAVRSDGSPGLGRVDLTLDGEAATLPVLAEPERMAIALTQGVHHLRGHYDRGKVLVPCALLGTSDVGTVMQTLYFEHPVMVLSAAGARVDATLPEPGTRAYVSIEVHPAAGSSAARLRVRADRTDLGVLEVHAQPGAARGATETGLAFVLEVPAGAQHIEVEREDAGAALSLRVLLRASGPVQPATTPQTPAPEPIDLTMLHAATHAVRVAPDPSSRARARLSRAALLAQIGMAARAKAEVMRALPFLDESKAGDARALLARIATRTMLAAPDGRHALLLAAAAGLSDPPAALACVEHALATCRDASIDCQAQLASCPSATAAYVAARMYDRAGETAAAAARYARAYSLGAPPALATEAAVRLLEVADRTVSDPGVARMQAFALAEQAQQAGEWRAARAEQRARRHLHWNTLNEVEGGTPVSLPAVMSSPSTLQAALDDLPWPRDEVIVLSPGRSMVSSFQLQTPTTLRIEAFCERNGAAPEEPERCPLTIEADGLRAAKSLRSGEITSLGEQVLPNGEHRVAIQLGRDANDAQVFVRVTTSRPIGTGAAVTKKSDGRYLLSPAARTTRRTLVHDGAAVVLALEGPTSLRVDGLFGLSGGAPRALDIRVTQADGKDNQTHVQVCGSEEERLTAPISGRFDCHASVIVPITEFGATQVQITPSATTEVALAFATTVAVSDNSLPPPAAPLVASAEVAGAIVQTAAHEDVAIPVDLTPPLDNLPSMLGTLQLQLREVYGSKAGIDPRVGDRYHELSVAYRRKLDGWPIWILGSGSMRLRDGSASEGLDLLVFAHIPSLQLRWSNEAQLYLQPYENALENSIRYDSYVERSLETMPRVFLLPRLGVTASERSRVNPPALRVTRNAPLDPFVWSAFDARHPFGTYGQLLLWWVPYENLIAFANARATTTPSVVAVDRYTVQVGLDLVFGTTELAGTYAWRRFVAGETRRQGSTHHEVGGRLEQTLWLTRGQRLGLRAAGTCEVDGPAYALSVGAFWEGSFDRGLDDYTPPAINFPEQLGRGRAIPTQERSLQ